MSLDSPTPQATRGSYYLVHRLSSESEPLLARVGETGDPDGPHFLLKALPEQPRRDWFEGIKLLKAVRSAHLRIPFAVESDPEGFYSVEKWLEGPSLDQVRVERFQGKVPVRQALLWLRHCLLALEVLHHHGLLHGDVKPSNLLLHEEDAVLVDLGCLQPVGRPLLESATPEYLIPDEDARLTVQRDLYAAALTFAALITGSLPNKDVSSAARLSSLDPLIPEAVDPLLARWASSEKRYVSAGEMLQEVDRLLGVESKPVTLSTSPPTRRVAIPLNKRRSLWPAVVFVTLCFPLGYAAAIAWKQPPVGPPLSLQQRSGIEAREVWRGEERVWQVTVLGRPVAAFVSADQFLGLGNTRERALWTEAVLNRLYFQKQALEFEYRRETPDYSEVWLTSKEGKSQLLMSIGQAERELFGQPAPALARRWVTIIEDTFTLLGFRTKPGRPEGTLLLRPWRSRAEALTGPDPLREDQRVAIYQRALESLNDDLQTRIQNAYDPAQDNKP